MGEVVGLQRVYLVKAKYRKIKGATFGEVVVGGKSYTQDICIRVDGRVKKRDKKLAKQLYGTSHIIGPEEVRKVCKGEPEVVFIGTGMSGMVALNGEARHYLDERSVKYEVLKTPEAIDAYNKSKRPRAAVIHVTC